MPRQLFQDDPSLFKFWDVNANPGVDVATISRQSGKEYNLKCPDCGHCSRRKIQGLNGCRFCTNQARCGDPTCGMCFANSLASKLFATLGAFLYFLRLGKKTCSLPTFVRMAMTIKAGRPFPIGIDVRQVAKGDTRTELKFMCSSCWHVFGCEAARVDKLKFCPFCSPVPKQLCDDGACLRCHEKSFASHPKAGEWDLTPGKNQGLVPRQVFKSGTHHADFVCEDCGHPFQATCNSVACGQWCPYCPGQKRCEDVSCEVCTAKKLSSHAAAMFWNYELNPTSVTPDQVSLTNGRDKWWFNCENGIHPPYQRDASHIRRNQMCSECSCTHKTERMVCDELRVTGFVVRKEFTPTWCRTGVVNSFPRFDIRIEGMNVLVEIDGTQHFKDKWKFGSPDERRKSDVWKMKRAVENGFSGIRLYQPDVYEGKIDWRTMLRSVISRLQYVDAPVWLLQNHPIYARHIEDAGKNGISVETF
jgi:hypothetical protein